MPYEPGRPTGSGGATRGIAGSQGWRLRRSEGPPVVVDLGYGASPVSALELHTRVVRVRADVRVVGIEIDPVRVAATAPPGWLAVDRHGPVSLTLSLRLAGLERPSDVAERLPKSLIHRNVAGERVHDYLRDLDST